MNKKSRTLEDMGEAAMLVNDFRTVKDEYFRLKKRHADLIALHDEIATDDHWTDRTFEEEIELFEQRKELYQEAQELYREMKKHLIE